MTIASAREKRLFEYRRRIDKATRYILDNIDRPLSLEEIAEQACFSKYHFLRLFTTMMNESPGEFITRKRLERAAIRLIYANTSVTRLAEEYGYSSVAAFSKAFSQWFGCRPTALKTLRERLGEGDGKLQRKHGKQLQASELRVPDAPPGDPLRADEIASRVTLMEVAEFELHYLTSPGGYDMSSVWETWQQLNAHVQRLVDPLSCRWFAISHDHPGLTPAAQCRYDACVALPKDAPPLNLPTLQVPGGRFAVYPVEGPAESILGRYLEFYTLWMPQSGYEPMDFPVLEHYLAGSSHEHVRAELWAKIQPIRFL